MSSVLVTGAAGFIGRHLVPRLRAAGHTVTEVPRGAGDLTNGATWASLPRHDVVMHLAARSFIPDSWSAPGAVIRNNLDATLLALDYCREHRARLVFPSSYLYGTAPVQPIPETAPLFATNPYAFSKRLAEEAAAFYAGTFGIDAIVFRLFNVYGPGQAGSFLIPTILQQLEAGREIRVKDLAPRRDYVYIRDIADAFVLAAATGRGFQVMNLGTGESHSVAELIAAIQAVWGTALPVVSAEERRAGEIMDTVADISRARTTLGWAPRYRLREGLADLRRSG